MPTITGWPAPTCARIHSGLGSITITVRCPGTFRAELKIAPLASNHPPCAAIEAGVTDENPKCEYTIARSDTRQPIFHTGNVPPTSIEAQRVSRWL